MPSPTRQQVVKDKLTQKASDSKKALYGGVAVFAVLFVYLTANYEILHDKDPAKVVELASTTILGILGLAATLITGQSCIDVRGIVAMQHMDEEQMQEQRVDRSNDYQIESNQPIQNLSVGEENPETPEVFVSDRRSPKDFLSHDLTI